MKLLSSGREEGGRAAISVGVADAAERRAGAASHPCRFADDVHQPRPVGPGESTLTRMPVPFRSSAQLRAKLRIAAFEAL